MGRRYCPIKKCEKIFTKFSILAADVLEESLEGVLDPKRHLCWGWNSDLVSKFGIFGEISLTRSDKFESTLSRLLIDEI